MPCALGLPEDEQPPLKRKTSRLRGQCVLGYGLPNQRIRVSVARRPTRDAQLPIHVQD
jgi:hypothetical protein